MPTTPCFHTVIYMESFIKKIVSVLLIRKRIHYIPNHMGHIKAVNTFKLGVQVNSSSSSDAADFCEL